MTKAELLAQIQSVFPENIADQVAALMLPVLTFVSAPDTPEHLSYFGGTPSMATEIDWPHAGASPYSDTGQRAERFDAQVGAHLAQDLPLAFVAQIDLAQTPESTLPANGRLLFFYDFIAGPYENGPRFGKVVWDTSPAQSAVERAVPQPLIDAEAQYIKDAKAALENFEMPALDAETIEALKQSGMSEAEIDEILHAPPPDLSDTPVIAPYVAPKRSVSVVSSLMLPSEMTYEFAQVAPDLAALFSAATDEAYELQERYAELVSDVAAPHMLGTPLPVQDDPRYNAAMAQLFGKQFLESGEWSTAKEQIFTAAGDWALLFEISVTTWMNDPNWEGTVYFLIRKDDLVARRFERAFAVYQQT